MDFNCASVNPCDTVPEKPASLIVAFVKFAFVNEPEKLAEVRFAPAKFAFVNVDHQNPAEVRFCSLKSHPLKSLLPRDISLKSFSL